MFQHELSPEGPSGWQGAQNHHPSWPCFPLPQPTHAPFHPPASHAGVVPLQRLQVGLSAGEAAEAHACLRLRDVLIVREQQTEPQGRVKEATSTS